jgi:hypothetical protein
MGARDHGPIVITQLLAAPTIVHKISVAMRRKATRTLDYDRAAVIVLNGRKEAPNISADRR